MLSCYERYHRSLVTALTFLVLEERCPRILFHIRPVSPPDFLAVVDTTFSSRYQAGVGVWLPRRKLHDVLWLPIPRRCCLLRPYRGQRYYHGRRVWTANFRISSFKSALSFSQFCDCLGLKRSLLQQGQQLLTFLYSHTFARTSSSKLPSVVRILCWQSMLTHLEPLSQPCSAIYIRFTFVIGKCHCGA